VTQVIGVYLGGSLGVILIMLKHFEVLYKRAKNNHKNSLEVQLTVDIQKREKQRQYSSWDGSYSNNMGSFPPGPGYAHLSEDDDEEDEEEKLIANKDIYHPLSRFNKDESRGFGDLNHNYDHLDLKSDSDEEI